MSAEDPTILSWAGGHSDYREPQSTLGAGSLFKMTQPAPD